MLRALPFQTISDIARHGLELHVYCPGCHNTHDSWPTLGVGPIAASPPRASAAAVRAMTARPARLSGSRERYRCPGGGGRVAWHIHGPAWRPGDASLAEGATRLA